MSTHNIGFYEDTIKQNYHLIIIKYHQICTLFLLLLETMQHNAVPNVLSRRDLVFRPGLSISDKYVNWTMTKLFQ